MAALETHVALLEQQAIQLDSPAPGSLSSLHLQEAGSLAGSLAGCVQTAIVATPYGPLHVTVQRVLSGRGSCVLLTLVTALRNMLFVTGDRHKPPIVTCHDIGFNHSSNVGTFLSDPVMTTLSNAFCWYHIDILGQEPDADKLPEDYIFPSMTQLAEQVEYMADHFQLASLIGLGVGSGADILARYATLCPHRVRGLVLVNCCLQGSDWTSPAWLLGKMAVWQLRGREEGVPPLPLSTLVNHSLGPGASEDAGRLFKECLSGHNPHNLSLLLHSYLNRSTIAPEFVRATRCRCLFITSSNYQYRKEVASLISQMPVSRATLLEVPDTSGLLLSEEPGKVATALCYFLQGLGLIPTHSSPLLSHPSPLLSLQGHHIPLQPAA